MPLRRERKRKPWKPPKPKPEPKPEPVPDLRICNVCKTLRQHVHPKGYAGCQCNYPGHP